MADFTLDGRVKVKTLKANFKEAFGSTLRVYKSVSCKGGFADDEATLASIRAEGFKGGDISVSGDMLVGDFETQIAELYGIGVQVANADDTALADNNVTLYEAGAVADSSDYSDDDSSDSGYESGSDSGYTSTPHYVEPEIEYEPWPGYTTPKSWFEFEDLVESYFVVGVQRLCTFASHRWFLGIIMIWFVGYIFAGLLTNPVWLYFLIKLVVRVFKFANKTYVPTPDDKKATLIPALKEKLQEYLSWAGSHPLLGILGFLYLWLPGLGLLLPVAIGYVPYAIVRHFLDKASQK